MGTTARGRDTHREAPLVTLERTQVQQLHLQQVAGLRRVHGDGPAQIMHLRRAAVPQRIRLARTVHPTIWAALVGIQWEDVSPHLCEVHMLDVVGAVVVLDLSACPVHRLHPEHLSIIIARPQVVGLLVSSFRPRVRGRGGPRVYIHLHMRRLTRTNAIAPSKQTSLHSASPHTACEPRR